MIEFSGFTDKAGKALNISIQTASLMGHTYVGSEHILCGLLSEESGAAGYILSLQGIKKASVISKIEKNMGTGIPTQLGISDFTPRSRRILENAFSEAKREKSDMAGTEHILYAMLADSECCGNILLKEMGADIEESIRDCASYGINQGRKCEEQVYTKRKFRKDSILSKYGRDLNALAEEKGIDPVLCREKELQRIIQALLRRRKNNPCLIGESGVGKTAIIEGLALMITEGNVPEMLKNKRIFMLDITSMIAGAKYRGDFEERIKSALEEVIEDKDTILFIDEIHTIVGAGSAEGAVDAANILKPILARGEIQLIGATTLDEYRRYIEKDSALERRFQPIMIEEPDENTTENILLGLKEKYESFHGVKISDEAIHEAVKLSARYIYDRRLPDKAIDVIDEAAAYVKLKNFSANSVCDETDKILKKLSIDKIKAIELNNIEKAQELNNREIDILQEIKKNKDISEKNSIKYSTVDTNAVMKIVSEISRVPVDSMRQDSYIGGKDLEDELKMEIIGQDKAVEQVSKAIIRGKSGLKSADRPIGSFLFLGPTGVGKTQLCKSLAKALFGSEKALIRLDMSEFMEKHTVSKIIGSPPGYVGFENGSYLIDEIRRKPYSVILFDEIEKAHPDIYNLLLQILDDGILTSSDGKKASFANTVIIMTGNIGASETVSNCVNIGFNDEKDNNAEKERIIKNVKCTFRPELINRIDEIIIFDRLDIQAAEKICSNMLDDLCRRAEEIGITLSYTDTALKELTQKGYDSVYGARPLRRVIVSEVEDKLAHMITCGLITENEKIIVDFDDEIRLISSELCKK